MIRVPVLFPAAGIGLNMSSTIAEALRETGVSVFERGWLSANNILIRGDGPVTLVDSGYCTHAEQTTALIEHALRGQALDLLLNTHLHSDHCGGNAALQASYPGMKIGIPPGLAEAVANWDPVALTFQPTGQSCPPFSYAFLLEPGTEIQLGSLPWEIHAAKGHDPHAILLFQPKHRLLLSADALWENGFGVVFPELEGIAAFKEVADTLDLIEDLNPLTVIPGHGRPFQDLLPALQRARSRLDRFVTNPTGHHRHAIKVLLKFKLLEWQSVNREDLIIWCQKTPYLNSALPDGGQDRLAVEQWLDQLLAELQKSRALQVQGECIVNT